MRLHIVGLPHTQTTREYCACAYTSKVVKGARMFMDAGHEVFIYSGEENEAPCAEHVPIVSKQEQREWWGKPDLQKQFPDVWQAGATWWKKMNRRAIIEIRRRVEPRDFILVLGGVCQMPITRALNRYNAESLEWGVGYYGVYARCCAFESYSHMHTVYAQQGWGDGRDFDAVIPNFFDMDDFPLLNNSKGEYLLFVGRLTRRKGMATIQAIMDETALPVVVAGQGATAHRPHRFLASEEITLRGNVEYVGAVGIEERAKLMAGAKALLAPTQYIEPFGGVAVEAQLCGTPAITTDWGAFPETVEQGVTGFRCRSLLSFCEAIERASELDPENIRRRAIQHFSLETVAPKYDDWFNRVQLLWGKGWYEMS